MLRELLPVTAAAAAAALSVAVVVTPAVSYLEGSLSGLVNDIPNVVNAPTSRLLAPGDVTVRVRPRTAAPSVALAEPEASPLELVTGQLGAALDRQDAGRRGTGGVSSVAAPKVTAPVPFEITPLVPLLPPIAGPVVAEMPDEVDDVESTGPATRRTPSKEVREPKGSSERAGGADSPDSPATFSVAGIKAVEDSPDGGSKSSGAASSKSADAEGQKHRQQDGQKHAQEPPASSEGRDDDSSAPAGEGKGEPEPKAKNSKPEKR